MIKTIIFDNHGVITTGNEDGAFQKYAKFLNLKIPKVKTILEKEFNGADKGRMTLSQAHRKLLKILKITKDIKFCLKRLNEIHFSSYKPKSEVRNFAKTLGKKYEIALFTNFGSTFDEYNKKWKLEKIFSKNRIFLSYKIKKAKPDKSSYLYVLKKLKRNPKETVFIDDNKQYIAAAKKVGMNTILFKSLSQLKQDLRKYIKL